MNINDPKIQQQNTHNELIDYKKAFDNSSDAIVWVDLSNNEIINCNNAFTNLVGRDEASLIGTTASDYCSDDMKKMLKSKLRKKISLKNHTSDGLIYTKKGEVKPVSISSSTFTVSDTKILQLIYRDLFYLKTAEINYKMLFLESNQGITLIEEDGSIVDANPEFMRQTGRTLKELLKMKIWDLRPDELQEKAKETFQLIKEEGSGKIFGLDFQKPDKTITRINFRTKIIKINGKTYIQSITTDITDKVLTEELLLKQQDLLKKQRDEMDSFCTSVAHDIRGKLQVITLYNDLSSDVQNKLKVSRQVDDIVSFLNNMLLLSKTVNKTEFVEVNLNSVLMKILVSIRELKPDIVIDLLKLPTISGNETNLSQVFENLIINVFKHADAKHLKIYSTDDKSYHTIVVEDNGIGIKPETQKQIRRSWETGKYFSIGLMIAKRIMIIHNGNLDFESEEGKGCKFYLTFPK